MSIQVTVELKDQFDNNENTRWVLDLETKQCVPYARFEEILNVSRRISRWETDAELLDLYGFNAIISEELIAQL